MEQDPHPSARAFGAILLGFDVEGFSRTVEKAALRHGRGAGELAAQQILAGEHVATDLARRAGLRFADALGDGAVYLRAQDRLGPQTPREMQALEEELRYAHLKATGLTIRTAWTHGQARLFRPAAPMLEHSEVLWGEAVERLHATLAARPRSRRGGRDPAPEGPGPDLASREGEITEMTFVYLRLCRGADWIGLDGARFNAAIGLIGRWAGRLGGRLERVTHDEKGVHARVGLPGVDPGARDWAQALREPQAALRSMDLDGAVAAAGGPVYRGPSEHGSNIVHGGAVNRAAKLCAAQPPGGLAVDDTLAGLPGRGAPATDLVVGRQAEREAASYWLEAGGPRLVILDGPAGIGKSHLMGDILRRIGGRQAFVAGAPALMLDPMGAWFELLGQTIARTRPAEEDLAWARAAFAAAGLEENLLPLCARALRGPAAETALTAALAGAERARLTQAGLLALAQALAREAPLWIAIDDLPELDDASLALTAALLDSGAAVRIAATRRTGTGGGERLAALENHLSALALPIRALDAAQIAELAVAIAGPGVDGGEVMAVSDGNPFLAVQAALALAEDGAEAGASTLSAILDRRLDRLELGEREVLAALCVADRPLRAEDVESLTRSGGETRPARETMARLARARLIAPSAADPEGFQPAHRLLLEVVRRRTPAGVRRRLSGLAARRLARTWGRRAAAPPVEIARLWAQAGSRGRAAILYEKAADQAAVEGADSTCAAILELAIGLFPEQPPRARPRRSVRWLAELARARWSLGLVDAANLSARRAAETARGRALPRRLNAEAMSACALRAETGQFMGDLRDILLGTLEAGRYGATSAERAAAQGRGVCAVAYILGLARLGPAADSLLSRGERLTGDADPGPAAYALTARSLLHLAFARWPAAEDCLSRARTILAARAGEHAPTHQQLLEWIDTTSGIGAHLQGDGARALRHFTDLDTAARRRGSAMHMGWAAYASAQTLMALDRPHEAWERLGAADQMLEGVSDRQSHHICQGLRARLAWRLGEIDEALAAAAACGIMGRSLPPTNHTSTEAYAAPALIGALALNGQVSPAQRRAGRDLVAAHLGELRSYALVFPIARPRLALVRALVGAPRAPARARSALAAAAAQARGLGLAFEAALAEDLQASFDLGR